MSIAVVATRGYGSFGTIADVVRAGYSPGEAVEPPVVVVTTTQVGGGEPSWQDFVTAEFRRKHLQHLLVQEEKKLKAVKKKLRTVEKKVKSGEKTEGILANLLRLEFRKDELENKIQAIRVEIIPVEMFLEADIDDDDEEVMNLFQ